MMIVNDNDRWWWWVWWWYDNYDDGDELLFQKWYIYIYVYIQYDEYKVLPDISTTEQEITTKVIW